MKERFIENGIEYVRNGDYYIPQGITPYLFFYAKLKALLMLFAKTTP